MPHARLDYDQTPAPNCGPCRGMGYVKASYEERHAYWKFVSHQCPE